MRHNIFKLLFTISAFGLFLCQGCGIKHRNREKSTAGNQKDFSQKAPSQSKYPSKANYEKIKAGMPESTVEAILGKGEEVSSTSFMGQTAKIMQWTSGFRNITVQFQNGNVISKAQVGF
jgi:hypothetical protein